MTETETAVVARTNENPFALMDAMDETNIVARLQGRVTNAWVYSIPVGRGTQDGLSADGVEEAARFLATERNEMLRELECGIESENDREARFIAKAGRYRVHLNEDTGEVHEILLDTAIRGKRQPKTSDFWYEQGVTKAVRNAKMALLPEELIAAIIEKAKATGKVQTAAKPSRKSPPAPPPQEQRPKPPEPAEVREEPAEGDEPATGAEASMLASLLLGNFSSREETADFLRQNIPGALENDKDWSKESLQKALTKARASEIIEGLKTLGQEPA